jgi:hypothetical protein
MIFSWSLTSVTFASVISVKTFSIICNTYHFIINQVIVYLIFHDINQLYVYLILPWFLLNIPPWSLSLLSLLSYAVRFLEIYSYQLLISPAVTPSDVTCVPLTWHETAYALRPSPHAWHRIFALRTYMACSIRGPLIGEYNYVRHIRNCWSSWIRRRWLSLGVLSGRDLQPQAARPLKRFFVNSCYSVDWQ